MRLWLAIGAVVGVILWAATSLILGAGEGVVAGLVGGLFFGLLAGLWYGGVDVLQHYTLRLTLAARGYMPLHYARFLDYAAALIFLQKAGGGYLFVHRLLLEHLAARPPATGQAPTATPADEAVPALLHA